MLDFFQTTRTVASAVLFSLVFAFGPATKADAGNMHRVSVTSAGGQVEGVSIHPSISSDGQIVAFQSSASDMVVGDSNGEADIFAHDLRTGATNRVSVASDGSQADAGSQDPSISGNGQYVAFASAATNLVPELTSGVTEQGVDVFVHDRNTGITTRESVSSTGEETDDWCIEPSLSYDGRFVAFTAWDTGWEVLPSYPLAGKDENLKADVYFRDRTAGTTTIVSFGLVPAGSAANGDSDQPRVSGNGLYVVFHSTATNLRTIDTNGVGDVYVYNVMAAHTTRVPEATEPNGESLHPSIDYEGRYIAFASDATKLVAGDTNGKRDIFVYDRNNGNIELVSKSSDGELGNDLSDYPSISPDGRYVAFTSYSTNLVPDDNNIAQDVFLHDRQTGKTIRVSTDTRDSDPNSFSESPAVSNLGRYVAFRSDASDLVQNDTNLDPDVFVRYFPSGGSISSIFDLLL
ncbi:MAG: TolB family protein [Syntrophobacteraceae bacterium]